MSAPVLTQRGLPLIASCTEYISTCMPTHREAHGRAHTRRKAEKRRRLTVVCMSDEAFWLKLDLIQRWSRCCCPSHRSWTGCLTSHSWWCWSGRQFQHAYRSPQNRTTGGSDYCWHPSSAQGHTHIWRNMDRIFINHKQFWCNTFFFFFT